MGHLMHRSRAGWTAGGALLLILLLLPLVIPAGSLGLPTEIFLFGVFALTYDLLFGFTGLISFGHALFVGSGAYITANLLTQHHLSLAGALVGAAIGGLFLSALTGAIALRTRGVYFAMVTLAFAQAAYTLAESDVAGWTGGDNGMTVSGAPDWLTGPGMQAHMYYVALLVLVAAFLVLRLTVSSPAGTVWQAIRENERRTLIMGYNPYAFKLLSYVVGGTICSLAGGVYAVSVGGVSTNLFSSDLTIQMLLMVIIGGAGSLWGALFGAAVIRSLYRYLNDLSTSSLVANLPGALHGILAQPLFIFGVVYLALVYFFPQGVAGLVQRYWRWGTSATPDPGLLAQEGRAVPAAEGAAESPRGV